MLAIKEQRNEYFKNWLSKKESALDQVNKIHFLNQYFPDNLYTLIKEIEADYYFSNNRDRKLTLGSIYAYCRHRYTNYDNVLDNIDQQFEREFCKRAKIRINKMLEEKLISSYGQDWIEFRNELMGVIQ